MSETPSQKPIEPTLGASLALHGRRLVRYVVGFVIAVMVIDGVFGEKGLVALLKARGDYVAADRALHETRAQNAALREQTRRLKEDPTAIEEVARRELGLIKPGETLFIIRPQEAPRPQR